MLEAIAPVGAISLLSMVIIAVFLSYIASVIVHRKLNKKKIDLYIGRHDFMLFSESIPNSDQVRYGIKVSIILLSKLAQQCRVTVMMQGEHSCICLLPPSRSTWYTACPAGGALREREAFITQGQRPPFETGKHVLTFWVHVQGGRRVPLRTINITIQPSDIAELAVPNTEIFKLRNMPCD